tara:strand:+ start:952 stop:1158 length:207 start_codon:yes stop_codon:yes gene_type:complete
MGKWTDALFSKAVCFDCQQRIAKKTINNVKVDTQDGPLELTLCDDCVVPFNDMLKELEETIAQRNNSL